MHGNQCLLFERFSVRRDARANGVVFVRSGVFAGKGGMGRSFWCDIFMSLIQARSRQVGTPGTIETTACTLKLHVAPFHESGWSLQAFRGGVRLVEIDGEF